MSEWIKCSEKLPVPGEWVLGCFNNSICMITVMLYQSGSEKLLWDSSDSNWKFEEISHWMKLPKPPETEG